ncbi:hypothetical protein CXB51_020189 [Gossypium anomalum]|uniref:Uncharacterized protein n=1 Tax=Gossypium anomalum TaxID=47600 RepID=A0A8J6CV97_9ROSI|nr:hypothetical protein CXB51_020189 [Gossypium anomalum]
MDRSKGSSTPMITTWHLSAHVGSPIEDKHLCRSIIVALQYVVITRLDIAFSMNKDTLDHEVRFTRTLKLLLEGYSDEIAGNLVLHSKFKHVELDLFFVREKFRSGSLQVGHVPSQDQIVDIFTKLLSAGLFTKFRGQLKVLTNSHEVTRMKESHQERGILTGSDLALTPFVKHSRILKLVVVDSLRTRQSLVPGPSMAFDPNQSNKRIVKKGSNPIHNRC